MNDDVAHNECTDTLEGYLSKINPNANNALKNLFHDNRTGCGAQLFDSKVADLLIQFNNNVYSAQELLDSKVDFKSINILSRKYEKAIVDLNNKISDIDASSDIAHLSNKIHEYDDAIALMSLQLDKNSKAYTQFHDNITAKIEKLSSDNLDLKTTLQNSQTINDSISNQMSRLNTLMGEIERKVNTCEKDLSSLNKHVASLPNISNVQNNIHQQVRDAYAARDERIALIRDHIFLFTHTSSEHLQNIYKVMSESTYNYNLYSLNELNSAFGIYGNLSDVITKDELVYHVASSKQASNILASFRVRRDDSTFTFSFKGETLATVLTKDVYSFSSVVIFGLLIRKGIKSTFQYDDASVDMVAFARNVMRNSFSSDIASHKIFERTILSFYKGNISDIQVHVTQSNQYIPLYYSSLLSSEISYSDLSDAIALDYFRRYLSKILSSSALAHLNVDTSNPFASIIYDLEVLKNTTVRSRYVNIKIPNNNSGYILGNSKHIDLTDRRLTMYKSYANDPSYSAPINAAYRIWSFEIATDNKLITKPTVKLFSAPNITPTASHSDQFSTINMNIHYQDDDKVLAILGRYQMQYNVSNATARAWLSTDNTGKLWTTNLLPDFSPSVGKHECSSQASESNPYAMTLGLRATRIMSGFIMTESSEGIVLKIRIPIPPALPSTSVVDPDNTLIMYAGTHTIGEQAFQWESVNVISNGQQHVEIRCSIDISLLLSRTQYRVIVPTTNLPITGWHSLIMRSKPSQAGREVSSQLITNGNATYNIFGTMRNEAGCLRWTNITLKVSTQYTEAIKHTDPYIQRSPDYNNYLVHDDTGLFFRGQRVMFKFKSDTFKSGFLQDPLHVGSISLVDYEKHKLKEDIYMLQISSKLIYELLNDARARIKYIEESIDRTQSSGIAGAIVTVISVGSVIAPYLHPLANVIFQLLSITVRTSEIIASGISANSIMSLAYDMYVTIALFKSKEFATARKIPDVVMDFPKRISNQLAKRINAHKHTNGRPAQQLTYNLNTSKQNKIPKVTIKNNALNNVSCDVEHVVRPLESMRSISNKFSEVAKKVEAGTASKFERELFHRLRDSNLLPMHNYLRMTNYQKNEKHINILGVSDGYSANYGNSATPHLIGNQKFQAIKLKSDGSGGIGVWRMKFTREGDEWKLLPYSKSGMDDIEILLATGLSREKSNSIIAMSNLQDKQRILQTAYEYKSREYIRADDHSSVKRLSIMLQNGQFDAIHNAIRLTAGDFSYTLLRHNCQHIADDMIKLMKNPMKRPSWMHNNIHRNYVEELRRYMESDA